MFGLNRTLLLLFAVNISVAFNSQLVQPLFPLYLNDLGYSEFQSALVISLGNLSSVFLMLPGGMLIERIGRRRMLAISAVMSGGSVLPLLFVTDLVWVTSLYILLNLAFCFFIPTRMAMVAENTTLNRATLFGVMNLAWPIGGIIGPVLSGFLVEKLSWGAVFITASTISIASFFFISKMDKDSKPQKPLSAIKLVSKLDRELLSAMGALFILQVFSTTSMAGINMILPLFLKDRFQLSYSLIGAFFTGSNIILILTQLGGGCIADRFNRRKILLVCFVLTPLALGFLTYTSDWITMFLIYSTAFGLWSLTWPAILALISDIVPKDRLGVGYGLNMTGSRLGFALGPMAAGFLYREPGSVLPLITSAIIFVLGLPVAWMTSEPRNQKKSSTT